MADKTKVTVKVVSPETKQALIDAEKLSKKLEEVEKQSKTVISEKFGKNFAGGVDIAVSSLRALNSIFPDTISGIGEIVAQFNAAKQAMAAGASAPVSWATAIISGIGIVAELITSNIEKIKKEEEDARQRAVQAAEESKNSRNDLSNLSDEHMSLKTKLDSGNLSYSEEVEIKSKLLELQKKIIEKYGEEAGKINILSSSVSEYREEIRKLAKEKADNYLLENESAYNNAEQKLQETSTYSISRASIPAAGIVGWDQLLFGKLADQDVVELIKNKFGDSVINIPGEEMKITLNNKEAKDKLKELRNEVEKLKGKDSPDLAVIDKTINWYDSEKGTEIENYNTIIEEYERQKKISANNGEEKKSELEKEIELQEKLATALEKYKSSMSNLSSAYQTAVTGGELNSETLQSLSKQYPEIAKYIEETGDATLNNGKLLEDAYNSEQSAAKKAIYAEMGRLNVLIANGEASDYQKEEYDELRDMVSLYTDDILSLQDTIDIYTGKMSDLSSAYQTVSEGGELNANTLQSLCEQYPDLANYISETGDLTLKNGEKIKEAYENEKKLLIEKLTEKKKELELEKEDSENKEKVAKDLAQVNAELEICNNLQLEASEQELNWSNISSEVKNLASAYQTLNEGKQLDIDTMISLIDKYPEVAAAMAKEGQLGKDQAEVLKQIFEAKKKEYILTQQNIIANRQSSEEDKKAAQARLKAIENYNIDSSKQSGGNTDDSNKALANELKQLEHKKAIGQLNSQQEYNWLVRINNKYRKNADEQSDMEKRLYNAKKQMQADEEAANTKALQEAYKGIENKKSLGKMNSQQELRQLEQIRQRYKMTAEERMELEIKIYNLKKSLKDDEISSINTLADAVTEALKQKYEEQRKLEEDRINESIESWQNWEDKTVSAIQGEIDALDELAKKQDSENKRQEYENKRQQTELQLAYEKDDYNRTQLQKELARLDKEEAERLAEEQREAKKKALEGRIEAVKGQSQATQERLNKELDKLGEKYEKLTDSFSLKAQAQKFIADSTQKQIISLIKSYASDYEIAGNTIGDALYNGMKAKMDNISAYIDGVFGKIEAYQRQMANTANASADRFWASQNSAQSAKKQSSQKAVTVKQTVNFNQPIESPVETRRQLDRTNQALAKQISNGI